MPKQHFISCIHCDCQYYKKEEINLCPWCFTKYNTDKIIEENLVEKFNNGSTNYRNKFLKIK